MLNVKIYLNYWHIVCFISPERSISPDVIGLNYSGVKMPVITYTMNHTLVLTIDGELDHATVEEIRRIFNSLIQKHSDVLVDLSSVSFIDSAGIGSLIYLYKQLQANGRRLRLICKQGQPRELLSILHIDRSITCYLSICDFLADISDKQSKTCLSDGVSLVI